MTFKLLSPPTSLTTRLEDAALALQDAQAQHVGAVVAVADAKQALKLAKAKLLLAGVEGKNAEQREAAIRLELAPLYNALHEAETAQAEARCALDCARLDWDLARYTVRAQELGQ